jgi:hypothetical protein
VEAATLSGAFAGYSCDDEVSRSIGVKAGPLRVYWDDHPDSGMIELEKAERRDVVRSRTPWHFSVRWERRGVIPDSRSRG